MTAELAHALRETADRAESNAEVARQHYVASALRLAEEVLRQWRVPEDFVAAYADARAALASERQRAFKALEEADAAEAELARANPFTADEAAWTNERALQQAATEKEAHNA